MKEDRMATNVPPQAAPAPKKEDEGAVEQIAPGVTREWRHNRRVVIYKVSTVDFASVEAWTKSVVELIKSLPPGQPYLSIQDFSGATLTPHIRKGSETIVTSMPPGLVVRNIVVASRSFMNQVMRFFLTIELMRKSKQATIRREMVFSLDEALQRMDQEIKKLDEAK
jgi:hypothetical protein